MKKMLFVSSILFALSIAGGCANHTTHDDIDARISSLESQVKDLSAQVNDANERSRGAEAAANRAEQTANDTNSKLDRMFKKSMMK